MPWRAQPIFKVALFPLRAGELEVGPMRVTIKSTLRGARTQGARESEALRIHVTDPPIATRPPGYEVGDVGRFALTATVEPRTAEVGGATHYHANYVKPRWSRALQKMDTIGSHIFYKLRPGQT